MWTRKPALDLANILLVTLLFFGARVAYADARILVENTYEKKTSHSGLVYYRIDLNASKSFFLEPDGHKAKLIGKIRWRLKKNGSVLKESNENIGDSSFYVILVPRGQGNRNANRNLALVSANEKVQVLVEADHFGEKISTFFNLWISEEKIYWDIDDYFDASKYSSTSKSPVGYSKPRSDSSRKNSSKGSVLLILVLVVFVFLVYINREKPSPSQSHSSRSTPSIPTSPADASTSASEWDRNQKKYDIPGYDSSWSHSVKKDFLRNEFAKWNSRVHSATNAAERKKIQRLLDELARARLDL